jgi:geranylgeranyl diphosphate synthase type II
MMDNALVRRGKPVVHVKWNNNIALLSGDAMSVIAYKYISGTKNHLQEILDVFSDTALKICEGQQFDMDFENAKNVSEDEYLKMINLKTAVLLAASLKIGAITANANAKDCENIYEFGRNLGMAFQLQDDLLDVFGDTEKFGKKIGGDIVANKKTYLLIKALELADEKTKEDLNYWLMAKEFVCDEKIVAVKTIYESLNIGEFSAKLMNAYFQTAFECFDSISLPLEKKEQLLSFTNKLRNREF